MLVCCKCYLTAEQAVEKPAWHTCTLSRQRWFCHFCSVSTSGAAGSRSSTPPSTPKMPAATTLTSSAWCAIVNTVLLMWSANLCLVSVPAMPSSLQAAHRRLWRQDGGDWCCRTCRLAHLRCGSSGPASTQRSPASHPTQVPIQCVRSRWPASCIHHAGTNSLHGLRACGM